MAEKIEVKADAIQKEMEETWQSLAEKLTHLGNTISGTVEAVEETVEDIAETASETMESVRKTFNLRRQANKHPWLVFGGAVAVGFVGGRLLRGRRLEHAKEYVKERARGAKEYTQELITPQSSQREYRDAEVSGVRGVSQEYSQHQAHDGKSSSRSSWINSIMQPFGFESSNIKGLAIGSLFSLGRELVIQALPDSFKSEVGQVFDNLTRNAGGKPIHGSLFQGSHQESRSKPEEHKQDLTESERERSSEYTGQSSHESQASQSYTSS